MYPRSKFQEILLDIREEMARDADFDVDLFVELVRSGARREASSATYSIADGVKDATATPARGRSATRPRGGR